MTSRAEEQLDQEVGLDHKDADEQTFTEYVPHTFQAPVFKKHPDPGELAHRPCASPAPTPCVVALIRVTSGAAESPAEKAAQGSSRALPRSRH